MKESFDENFMADLQIEEEASRGLKAFQLLARLRHLALTQGNWNEEMFIGTNDKWLKVTKEEQAYE